MQKILLTGATGILGSEVLQALHRTYPEATIVGVSRRRADGISIHPWHIGHEPPPEILQTDWDIIVNCAASTRWNMSREDAIRANVDSVRALEALVSPATRVVHVSTAFVAGLRGSHESTELSDYRNTYEWSKAAAERVAVATFTNCAIVRPPLIVGRRSDGRIARYNGLYTCVRASITGLAPALVGDERAYVDIAPVDDVARLVVDATRYSLTSGPVVRTIACGSGAPTLGTIVETTYEIVNDRRRLLGLPELERVPIVSTERWNRFYFPFIKDLLRPNQMRAVDLLNEFGPYLTMSSPLSGEVAVPRAVDVLRQCLKTWVEDHPRAVAAKPKVWAVL